MNHRRGAGFAAFAGAFCLLVAACSPPAESVADVREGAETRPTEADRRAARLLSLSNNGAAATASDPYEAAIGCVVAIDALNSQVAASSSLDDEQKRALAVARSFYERRASDAGEKTRAQIARDIEAAKVETDDRKQRLLTALSCLRELT